MPSKADSATSETPPGRSSSGKLVIFGILATALAAAGGSWWFRYAATHRAALFWGAANVRLIRDAAIVELYRVSDLSDSEFAALVEGKTIDAAKGREVSRAPGLAHLRNALIEDRSFDWPPQQMRPGSWGWLLVFRESRGRPGAPVLISSDWQFVDSPNHDDILSCKPISSGLADVLTEYSQTSPR